MKFHFGEPLDFDHVNTYEDIKFNDLHATHVFYYLTKVHF